MAIDSLNNEYIDEAILNLTNTLGIKEEVESNNLLTLLRKNKVKKCIEKIANHLGLPIKVNLSYVSADYQPPSNNNHQTSFTSQDIVKTNSSGKGAEAIIAQVKIPSNLPLYGTPRFNKFTINIKISENCKDHPKSFIAIMAHELSHIVLYSILHKEKNNEVYTDLTAMILGFAQILDDGRKVVEKTQYYDIIHTSTTTYGYLKDDQFQHAYYKIYKILNHHKRSVKKISKKLNHFKKKLNFYQKQFSLFNNYTKYLETKKNIVFNKKDTQKIIDFHQSNYKECIISVIKDNRETAEEVGSWLNLINHYRDKTILLNNQKILDAKEALQLSLSRLQKDIKILTKYINFWQKIKTNIFIVIQKY